MAAMSRFSLASWCIQRIIKLVCSFLCHCRTEVSHDAVQCRKCPLTCGISDRNHYNKLHESHNFRDHVPGSIGHLWKCNQNSWSRYAKSFLCSIQLRLSVWQTILYPKDTPKRKAKFFIWVYTPFEGILITSMYGTQYIGLIHSWLLLNN